MTGRSHRGRKEIRSSIFRYYLHDGVDCFRLQLIGELSDAEVPELSGCWNTARTTLSGRPLILDLRQLQKTDEPGREWLLGMIREGASCLPDSYFRDLLAKETGAGQPQPAPKAWSRVKDLIRAEEPELDVEPSSQG